MARIPAPPNPALLAQIPLETVAVDPSALVRISRHATGEPYFGYSGGGRFDDPLPHGDHPFGTCYLGADLTVALAETLLHDAWPRRGRFKVSLDDIQSRFLVRTVGGQPLKLARLTGTALKALVGSSELSSCCQGTKPYAMPQRWSRALHDHPERVDGLLYMSRHINDAHAVVVFDRAAHKLGNAHSIPLMEAPGLALALKVLHMDVGV